jgi:hypothetical protein
LPIFLKIQTFFQRHLLVLNLGTKHFCHTTLSLIKILRLLLQTSQRIFDEKYKSDRFFWGEHERSLTKIKSNKQSVRSLSLALSLSPPLPLSLSPPLPLSLPLSISCLFPCSCHCPSPCLCPLSLSLFVFSIHLPVRVSVCDCPRFCPRPCSCPCSCS